MEAHLRLRRFPSVSSGSRILQKLYDLYYAELGRQAIRPPNCAAKHIWCNEELTTFQKRPFVGKVHVRAKDANLRDVIRHSLFYDR